jgi:hypothetical protein
MTLVKVNLTMIQEDKPFRGFISTWTTIYRFDKHDAKHIISEFKKIPILLNIQYVKRKYRSSNHVSVSFKNEEDEAAFILLTSGSVQPYVEIEVDDSVHCFWPY